jgi:hypothetical protein
LRRMFEVELEDGLEDEVEADRGSMTTSAGTIATTSVQAGQGQEAAEAEAAGPPPTMKPIPDSDPDSGSNSEVSAAMISTSPPAATATAVPAPAPATAHAARPPTRPSNQSQTPNETLRRLLKLLHTYPRYARKEVLAKLLGFEGELAVDYHTGSGSVKQESARGGIRGRRIRVDKVPEGGWVLRPFGPEHGGGGIAGKSTDGRSKHGKSKHPVPNQRTEMVSDALYVGEKETLAFRAFAECVRGVVGDGHRDAGAGVEWEV